MWLVSRSQGDAGQCSAGLHLARLCRLGRLSILAVGEAKYFLKCSRFAVIAAHGAVLSSSADHCVLGADRV